MTSDSDKPDAEEARIAKWRKEREAVAEAARQERLKAAEKERQERLHQAEIDKQNRVRAAKEAREADAVRREAKELEEAAGLLPDLDELASKRKRYKRRQVFERIWFSIKLFIFVVTPTLAMAYYSTQIAVPLFEARSVIVVSKAVDDSSDGLGGLLGASAGQGNLREVYMAHEYVQSPALMDLLEEQLGLVSQYSDASIDPLARLRDIPLLRITKHDGFNRFVDSSINIQTGLMNLYVRAPSPEDAVTHSKLILELVAEQINSLNQEIFLVQIDEAESVVEEAETAVSLAQAALTQLQIESGEVDPKARIESVFQVIAQLQTELVDLRTEIDKAEVTGESATYGAQRFAELEGLLQDRIEEQRSLMLGTGDDSQVSLNRLLVDYEQALLQFSIAQEMLTTALSGLSETREKAALGLSRIQVVVPPSTAPIPTKPNPLRSILTAFLTSLGLFGIYSLFVTRGANG